MFSGIEQESFCKSYTKNTMNTKKVPIVWDKITITHSKNIYYSQESKKKFISFVAGATGGTAGLIFGHPLDTIKTVAQNSTRKLGISEGFNGINKNGSRNFFRGLSLPFWSYAGINACLFSSYKWMLRLLDAEEKSTRACVIAGAFAGMVQLIPGTPVDVIKIHIQNDATKCKSQHKYGPFKCASEIVRNDGIRGLYKGVCIHALRDVPAFIIYFYSYKLSNELIYKYNIIENNLWSNFISGAIAGALSWGLLIPQDVMKTRIQAGIDKNIRQSFKALQKMGSESFFRGGIMLTCRALIVNAITFSVYEEFSKTIYNTNWYKQT